MMIDSFVVQILNSLDRTPVAPTKEELFLSFLICKNLADLCETGRAILNDMESRRVPIKDLPQPSSVETFRLILRRFYSDDMFIEDDELGHRPNWKVVTSFDPNRSMGAYKIYRAIRKNVVSDPNVKAVVTGQQIQDAIRRRDTNYFLKNLDLIFANIPKEFTEGLTKFKNFVASTGVLQEHRDYVWDFFESLLEICLREEEYLSELRAL